MSAAWMRAIARIRVIYVITVHVHCHVCCGQKNGDGAAALDRLKRHHGSLQLHAPLSYFGRRLVLNIGVTTERRSRMHPVLLQKIYEGAHLGQEQAVAQS